MYKQTRSTLFNPQEKLLLELFNSRVLTKEQEQTYLYSLPDLFPYKGTFSVIVSNKEKAEQLLLDFLNYDSLDQVDCYYDSYHYDVKNDTKLYNTFIKSENDEQKFCYNSKFNLSNLKDFLIILFRSDILVVDYHFDFPDPDCC